MSYDPRLRFLATTLTDVSLRTMVVNALPQLLADNVVEWLVDDPNSSERLG